jgi:glycosyltransferase involved in cell wall biosynthesis
MPHGFQSSPSLYVKNESLRIAGRRDIWLILEMMAINRKEHIRFSGVLPIHNEAAYLPYCLTSISNAPLYELICVLDRCTDNSQAILENFRNRTEYNVRIVQVKDRKWKFPTAEIFAIGFGEAEGDIVYSFGADCVYEPRIFMVDWTSVDFASFGYRDYPLMAKTVWASFVCQWRNNYSTVKRVFRKKEFSGIYAFTKAFYALNPISEDVAREDSFLLDQALKKGYRYKFFPYHNLHLRPALLSAEKQKLDGIGKAQAHYPLWKVALHSALFLKPETLRGYLEARS